MNQALEQPRPVPTDTRRLLPRWPRSTKWLFGPLLVVDVFLLLVSLSLANVTAPGPAQRALAHSVAILTEVDAFLDAHYETLQVQAQQGAGTTIVLADFPLPVNFSADEIAGADRQQFRALLLARSGALLHDEGVAAFREGRSNEIDSISPQGAVRAGLDLLRPTPHRVFVGLTIGLAAVGAILSIILALSTRGWGRLVALAASVLFAAIPFLVLAIALRFALRVAADGADDYATREFLQLGQELDWAPIRDGIIFTGGAGLALAIGVLLAWRTGAQRHVDR